MDERQAIAAQLNGATAPTVRDPYIRHYRVTGSHEAAVSRFYWQLDPPVAVSFIAELEGRGARKARYARLDRLCRERGWVHLVLGDKSQILDPDSEAAGVLRPVQPPDRYAEFGAYG